MKKTTLFEIGRQYYKLHQLELKARDARAAFTKKCLPGQFWTSASFSDNGIVMAVALAEYLAKYPDEKPEFITYDSASQGKVMGYMKYPAHYEGEISPGVFVWVEAHTATTPIADLPAVTEPVQTSAPTPLTTDN